MIEVIHGDNKEILKGIEREKEYVDISRARIDSWEVEESDKQLSIF